MLQISLFYQKQNVCMGIYYHFRRDHGSSAFRNLAVNKRVCQKICDYFLFLHEILHFGKFKDADLKHHDNIF